MTDTLAAAPAGVDGPCPSCGDARPGTPIVVSSLYPTEHLRRCLRCGARRTVGQSTPQLLATCETCGLPFLVGPGTAAPPSRCTECDEDRGLFGAPDRDVANAAERELMAALQSGWAFVSAPSLSLYLDRLCGQIGRCMQPRAPSRSVAVFEEGRWWSLALPSGPVLLSLGCLGGLEDEAELAFVLAHELAHAASPHASSRLARLALRIVALEGQEELGPSWAHAAQDLIRLGHGRENEREADRLALETVTALGYDPRSVLAYLGRLQDLVDRGDPRVAELALAHPLPAERLRWLEGAVAALPLPRVPSRVNREVFRRAAGSEVLRTQLEPVHEIGRRSEDRTDAARERRHRAWWLVLVLALVALALLIAGSYVV